MLPFQISIRTVTGNTADGFSLIRINQSGKDNGTDNVKVVIYHQTVRKNLANNLSGRQANRAVVVYLPQKFSIVSNGNALRNDAADKFAVKIYNQAVSGHVTN